MACTYLITDGALVRGDTLGAALGDARQAHSEAVLAQPVLVARREARQLGGATPIEALRARGPSRG